MKKSKRRGKIRVLGMDELINRACAVFLEKFKNGGFADPEYENKERNPKETALHTLEKYLNKETFLTLLSEGSYNSVAEYAKKVCAVSNLVDWHGHNSLSDLYESSTQKAELFTKVLFALMYGTSPIEERFTEFVDFFDKGQKEMWPLSTCFLSLLYPEKYAMLKPRATDNFTRLAGITIKRESIPTWEAYQNYLEMLQDIKRRLISRRDERLVPDNLRDVQSFVWVCCSDNYHNYDKLSAN